jgi:hypothetical protein
MVDREHALNVPTAATGAGTPQACRDLIDKWVQLSGTYIASVDVEASMAGTYKKIATAVASGDFVEIPQNAKFVRINVTAWTSGQPVATLRGRDARTD